MMNMELDVKGAWLTDKQKAERGFGEAMKRAMMAAAKVSQKALTESGKGTMWKGGGKPPDSIWLGNLNADYKKKPIVKGSLKSGYEARIGSKLPYARMIESGHPPGLKHPPLIGEQTFNVRRKVVSVKGTSKRRAHKRVIPAHTVKVPLSVLDKWIKSPMGMDKTGSSYKAARERASIAYLIGRKRKRKGVAGKHPLDRAAKKSARAAAKAFDTSLKRDMKRKGLD